MLFVPSDPSRINQIKQLRLLVEGHIRVDLHIISNSYIVYKYIFIFCQKKAIVLLSAGCLFIEWKYVFVFEFVLFKTTSVGDAGTPPTFSKLNAQQH